MPVPSTHSLPVLGEVASAVSYRHRRPAAEGSRAAWPPWLPAAVIAAIRRAGVDAPWIHQWQAAEAAHNGHPVALTTGTGSGKSLAFLMPVLAATSGQGQPSLPPRRQEPLDPLLGRVGAPRPTAIYLAPTKALAHDQLRAGQALGVSGWRLAGLDGDTPGADREWVRDYADYVLTNPDMLHYSVLPRHHEWTRLLRGLTYVVVDEAHHYRGVFGAHVSAVLARLRRLARHHGSDPVFLVASATAGSPGLAAATLLRRPLADLAVVAEDSSSRPGLDLMVAPAGSDPEQETAAWLAMLVTGGRQTLAFCASRGGAERVAVLAQQQAPDHRFGCYRGGYPAADRRQIERDVHSGSIRGLACTNALELGIDVSGVDAVVLNGFPGTRAAFWQQVGRAGRGRREALAVLLARNHPLDRYIADHPDRLHSPTEEVVLDPDNPYVLGPHLVAAAQELPLVPGDTADFGAALPVLVERLEREGALRRRPAGWYHRGEGRAVDRIRLRSGGERAVDVLEVGTGRVLEAMDPATADAAAHPGAVYINQGETYLVESLDQELGEALVRAANPAYITQPRRQVSARLAAPRRRRPCGVGTVSWGEVEIHSQVTGYLRRDALTNEVWDQTELDLPVRTLRTTGVWLTLPGESRGGDGGTCGPGGVHAAEHALVNLLGLFVACDAWDVGGVAAADHPDTGQLTVVVHDTAPRGSGFAARAYDCADAWVRAATARVSSCGCQAGCPACVLSARCSSPQQPLDKSAACALLARWAEAADAP